QPPTRPTNPVSLPDALPISVAGSLDPEVDRGTAGPLDVDGRRADALAVDKDGGAGRLHLDPQAHGGGRRVRVKPGRRVGGRLRRSGARTSELESRGNLVCRL